MVKVTYVQPDGARKTVEATAGLTGMEAAKLNSIEGVVGECGGACACATCHVYVPATWQAKVGKASQMEEDMLDFAFDVRPESRLSCQIKLTPELDGLELHVPAKQF